MRHTPGERLLEATAHGLRCIHALTGFAPAVKMCGHCYECGTCAYDQMLEDMDDAPVGMRECASVPVKPSRSIWTAPRDLMGVHETKRIAGLAA